MSYKTIKKERSHASSVMSQFVTAILNLFVLNVLMIKNKLHLLEMCYYPKFKTIQSCVTKASLSLLNFLKKLIYFIYPFFKQQKL